MLVISIRELKYFLELEGGTRTRLLSLNAQWILLSNTRVEVLKKTCVSSFWIRREFEKVLLTCHTAPLWYLVTYPGPFWHWCDRWRSLRDVRNPKNHWEKKKINRKPEYVTHIHMCTQLASWCWAVGRFHRQPTYVLHTYIDIFGSILLMVGPGSE